MHVTILRLTGIKVIVNIFRILKDGSIKNVDPKFLRDRQELSSILAEETKLMEIVKLMGSDVFTR